MQKPTFADMFSGAGFFSAAAVEAGMHPVLAIDVSPEAIATYNLNVAPVGVVGSVLDDIDLPHVDVLIAGPPCQGFSTLGRQDPLDERNRLALAVPDWAQRCGASVVVIENVPPFLQSAHWRQVRDRLASLGYTVDAWELEAADFGTPQYRRRSFTVASRVGPITQPEAWPVRIPASAALGLPIDAADAMHRWPTPKGIAASRIALVPACGDKRDIMKIAPELCPPSWAKVGCQATDVWGRIDPREPANTIRCTFQNPSKGRYLHPVENRTLSLREGARLQGVPDHWQFVGKPYPVARQIGNGVPIPLGTAVMRSIAEALASSAAELEAAA
jgi:DNA (cytosine-5)-methyltransferase 1